MMEYAVASYMERRKNTRHLMKQISNEQNQDQILVKNQVRQRRNTMANLMISVRPATVDVYSRILFPLAFMAFFGIYWTVLCLKLDALPEDMVVLQTPTKVLLL